ncbi:sex-lethal homolog isoform X2 [Artemia franciscana]|uniref:RRM domain-containing protein n=1 Tax=Artemia franciscana TaxID=6661 RepID=A0AA88HQ68_ARTSF|nr:hypothetical protein QYM36_012831 [Artemia franciscana]
MARVLRYNPHKTGLSYGFGFVNYVDPENAKRAIEGLNGLEVQGKRIKVSYARPAGQDRKDTNLYVTHLPRNLTEVELVKLFEPYGTIVQSHLLRDKITGLPRGVGFVRFDSKDQAARAMEALNGQTLPNSSESLNVKVAEDPSKMNNTFFAGVQTGKNMMMANAYAAYGGYETDYSGYQGGYTEYDPSTYYVAGYNQQGYAPAAMKHRMPNAVMRPGYIPPRPVHPQMMQVRPPPIPSVGPMKSRMQTPKRYNPMSTWDYAQGSAADAAFWSE